MSNSLATLTTVQIRQAIAIKERIEALEDELTSILSAGPAPVAAEATPAKKKRTMSVAGRARVAAAQRARWAKQKAAPSEPVEAPKPKRKLSAAGRAAIRAGVKARWAKLRASQAAAAAVLTPTASKAPRKRQISPEARQRMVAGGKARWAKLKTPKAASTKA